MEFASPKETSYCLFEKKTESYIKNGEEKNYEQTTRIDKNDKVSSIVQQLRDSRDSYLRHWKHVEYIATALPKIRERHRGRYIEMDFSENRLKELIFRESNTTYIVLLCNLVKLNLYIIWAMIQLTILALCNRCWKIFLITGKLEMKL